MTDQRGLPFIDAVKELAQAAGLEMPALDRRAAAKAERAKGLHEAMADAATWFTEQLNGLPGADARALLDRRGIKPETARAFGMGFAPDSRGKLKAALKEYGDPMLVEAGLLIEPKEFGSGKDPYDRFRGRLMIPIRDARGRTIAFGGRIIGTKESKGGEPKYLNSPDTPLFDKGRTLYNLDKVAPASRKANRVLVVEGYMDVIALAQAGIAEAVAPLGHRTDGGTSWSGCGGWPTFPILCFDGDAAGQKAALRAAHRALPLLCARYRAWPSRRCRRGRTPTIWSAVGRAPRRSIPLLRRSGAAGRSAVVERIRCRTAGDARATRRVEAAALRSCRHVSPTRSVRQDRISRTSSAAATTIASSRRLDVPFVAYAEAHPYLEIAAADAGHRGRQGVSCRRHRSGARQGGARRIGPPSPPR